MLLRLALVQNNSCANCQFATQINSKLTDADICIVIARIVSTKQSGSSGVRKRFLVLAASRLPSRNHHNVAMEAKSRNPDERFSIEDVLQWFDRPKGRDNAHQIKKSKKENL